QRDEHRVSPLVAEDDLQQDGDARDADDGADPKREVAGLRAVRGPARAEAPVVVHHRAADREHEDRDGDLHRAFGDARVPRHFEKPASLRSVRWYASSFSRNFTKSAPVRNVSLSALRSTYSFHSG